MPGVQAFLDIDDLENIGELETYVSQTASMLSFLSTGYFHSLNCLREVDAALKLRKPLVLVQETNESKGGAPLAVHKADCAAKGRDVDAIFATDVIRWERIHDFQLVSLKQICCRVLAALPAYVYRKEPLELYVPGELCRAQLQWTKKPPSIYVSPHNPGAREVGRELAAAFGDKGLSLVVTTPDYLADDAPAPANAPKRHGATHMLLYLSTRTFLGAEGMLLADEVRRAVRHAMPIVMLHENDPAKDGTGFETVFRTTPEDLIDMGLYRKLAIACYPGVHRQVSLALAAKGFGAEQDSVRAQLRRKVEFHREADYHATPIARHSRAGAATAGSRRNLLTMLHLHSTKNGSRTARSLQGTNGCALQDVVAAATTAAHTAATHHDAKNQHLSVPATRLPKMKELSPLPELPASRAPSCCESSCGIAPTELTAESSSDSPCNTERQDRSMTHRERPPSNRVRFGTDGPNKGSVDPEAQRHSVDAALNRHSVTAALGIRPLRPKATVTL